MALKKKEIIESVLALAEPLAQGMGLEIWDVEYQKEGPEFVLRVYIDRPGGVFIEDCEKLSRALDPELDNLDMPEGGYSFEVSSPGVERLLRTDRHLESYIGSEVRVRLMRPMEDGRRELLGRLESFDGESVTLSGQDGSLRLQRAAAAFIKLVDRQVPFGGDEG